MYKHPFEMSIVKIKNKNYTSELTESEIQKDFFEVWMHIEESIKLYELTIEDQDVIEKLDKGSIINLNLEL